MKRTLPDEESKCQSGKESFNIRNQGISVKKIIIIMKKYNSYLGKRHMS